MSISARSKANEFSIITAGFNKRVSKDFSGPGRMNGYLYYDEYRDPKVTVYCQCLDEEYRYETVIAAIKDGWRSV